MPYYSKKRRLIEALLIGSPIMLSQAGPTNGQIISGTGAIDYSVPTQTTITQSTQNIAIDWDSFDIGASETVTFSQPNINAIALNRDFSGNPSEIFGNLNAPGHVFLLNTAGVLIGASATLDVGSLLATDLSISDEDAQNFGSLSNAGSLAFSDADLASGGIRVLGTVTTQQANGMTLIGQYIYISGTTTSNNGDTTYAAGGSAVLVTDALGMFGVEVQSPVSEHIGNQNALVYFSDTADINVNSGNLNIAAAYYDDLEYSNQPVEPYGPFPDNNPTVLGGTITRSIQSSVRPLSVTPEEESIIDNTVSDSVLEEPSEPTSQLIGDAKEEGGSLDNLVPDCKPRDAADRDCQKQNAIKRYLGKLLIGGVLPD